MPYLGGSYAIPWGYLQGTFEPFGGTFVRRREIDLRHIASDFLTFGIRVGIAKRGHRQSFVDSHPTTATLRISVG